MAANKFEQLRGGDSALRDRQLWHSPGPYLPRALTGSPLRLLPRGSPARFPAREPPAPVLLSCCQKGLHATRSLAPTRLLAPCCRLASQIPQPAALSPVRAQDAPYRLLRPPVPKATHGVLAAFHQTNPLAPPSLCCRAARTPRHIGIHAARRHLVSSAASPGTLPTPCQTGLWLPGVQSGPRGE